VKVRKVKIGIKSIKEALDDFAQAAKSIERGRDVKPERGVYFVSIEGFRKALTPKRLELLHIIKTRHPKSLQELARFSNRDIKSIVTDTKLLEGLDLIDMKRKKEGRRESVPTVEYDKIEFEIAV